MYPCIASAASKVLGLAVLSLASHSVVAEQTLPTGSSPPLRRSVSCIGWLKRPRSVAGQRRRKPAIKAQVIHFINKPMPGGLPKKTARALLDIEDRRMVPVIRDPAKVKEDADAVFYFPGCGSERLFSQVGLATQAMLYDLGAITVLPLVTCVAVIRNAPPAMGPRASRSPPRTECCFTASPTRSTISTSRR